MLTSAKKKKEKNEENIILQKSIHKNGSDRDLLMPAGEFRIMRKRLNYMDEINSAGAGEWLLECR